MNYHNFVRDFAERTERNLELIRQAREAGQEAYEVTQLINSMLGLIVLPKEMYYDEIPETPLAELRQQGWPEPLLAGDFESPRNLRDLVRLLRNSVAHFNVEFTEAGGEIDGVILTNKRNRRVTWQATLSLADLEEVTRRFIRLIRDPG